MKRKVSILTPNFSKGGADRAYGLSQALIKAGYDVEVLGFLFGEKIYPVPPEGLDYRCFPGSEYPKFMSSARKLLSQINGDLIYAVKPRPTSFGLGLLKKTSKKLPIVLDIDDWELGFYGGDSYRYRFSIQSLYRDIFKKKGVESLRFPDHPVYLQRMERRIKKADLITTDTSFMQNRFGGVYLPNGVDTNMFDPSRVKRSTSQFQKIFSPFQTLVFPGAPRPHKGVEDVLAALEIVNNKNIRLVIVGGSPYDAYDKYIESKWGKWIISLPQQPRELMPEVIANADIFVVPQRDTVGARAQFPIKLCEGMAMAKPILSTRVGDIPKILGNTAYLAKPEASKEMAELLHAIFSDYDQALAKGELARGRCIERYSLDCMAKTLSTEFNKLFDGQS